MTLRSVRGVRQTGMKRDARTNVWADTDLLTDRDQPHQYARDVLVPMIAEKSKNALEVDTIPIHYFQRKRSGRICTCWENTERMARQDCPVCFGTGRPSGYLKFGTETLIMDASTENLILINVKINDSERPWRMELVDGKMEGFIEGSFFINGNLGTADSITVSPLMSARNYSIKLSDMSGSIIKYITDRTWVDLLSEQQIKIRITLRRDQASNPNPYIESLILRYDIFNKDLNSDWPRLTTSVSMDDLGLPDIPASTTIAIDNTIQIVSVEDFIFNIRTAERWKIIENQENFPLNINTSPDVTIRKIQDFEIYSEVPI